MKSQLYWKIGGNFTLEFVGCVSLIYLVKLGSPWAKEEASSVMKFTLSMHKNYVISLDKGALWIQGQATAASVLWGFTKLLHLFVLRFLLCHEEVGIRIRSHAGCTWCADVSLRLTGHFGETFIGCFLAQFAGLLFATFLSPPSFDRYTWLSSLEARASSGKQTTWHLKLILKAYVVHQDSAGSQDLPFTFYHFTVLSQVTPRTSAAHIPESNKRESIFRKVFSESIFRKYCQERWHLSAGLCHHHPSLGDAYSVGLFLSSRLEPLVTMIFSTCSRTLKFPVSLVLVAHKLHLASETPGVIRMGPIPRLPCVPENKT